MDQSNALTPLLSDQSIEPFLIWMRDEVLLRRKRSVGENILIYGSAFSSILAAGSAFMLGMKFGKHFHFNDPALEKFLQIYFGVSAYTPVAALSMRSATSVCADVIRKRPISEQKLLARRQLYNAMKCIYNLCVVTVACCASISDVYNTAQQFYPELKLTAMLFITPDILIAPLFNGYYFDELNQGLYSDVMRLWNNRSLHNDRKLCWTYRKEIIAKLREKLIDVMQQPTDAVTELLEQLRIEENQLHNLSAADMVTKINFLFSKRDGTPEIISNSNCSILKTLFGFLGASVSAVGTFAFFFSLSQEGAQVLCDYLDIEDEESRHVFNTISASAVILAKVALAGYTNRFAFEKYFDLFAAFPSKVRMTYHHFLRLLGYTQDEPLPNEENHTSCCRALLYIITIIIAASSTSSRAELVMEHYGTEQTKAQFFIASAVIGTFGTRFWAIDSLIDNLIHHSSPHRIIKSFLDKVIEIIPRLSDPQIVAIYTKFVSVIEPESLRL